jgi:tetratricopeptide (TPR) repeat protein
MFLPQQLNLEMQKILRSIIYLTAFVPILFLGCSSSSRLERHIQRADSFYEKGEFDKARIEYLNAYKLDPNDAHVSGRLGEAFLKQGDVRRAAMFFVHSLTSQPTNNDVRIKLATIYLLVGEAVKARKEALDALKLAPLNSDALLIYANSSIQSNEVVEAQARFESLASSDPSNVSIQLGVGTLAQRAGQFAAAEAALKKAVELDSKSPKTRFALGSYYFQQGDITNSGTHLKAAMELSPLQSVERLGYAEYLLKSGQANAAENLLNEATAKHPEFTAAWNMLTQLSFARNDTNKAAEYIAKALSEAPQDRDALLNQSRLKLVSRDFKSAVAELEQLSTSRPYDSQVHFQLAVAHLASTNANQAAIAVNKSIAANTNNIDALLLRARLQISRSDWQSAILDLTQLIRRIPNAAPAYYLLATAQRARGNLDEAARVYTAVTRIFPKDPQGFQSLGEVLYAQSLQTLQKDASQARKAFEKALEINPDFLAAIDSLTELDIAAKDFDHALKRVNFYAEKYPKSPLPPLLLGKIFFLQQRNDEAEAAVKKAIALEPEFLLAHRILAKFYNDTKQVDKAIEQLESLVAKDKEDIASLIQLGMLYESKQNYDRSLELYNAALKLKPNSWVALNNVACIYSEQKGDVEKALQYARTARDVAPRSAEAADTLGWILWKKGQYPEALAALQQAIERLHSNPEVQYHLGMAQYMVGDVAAATTSLTRATQSTNDFLGMDLAREALTILKIDPTKSSTTNIALIERHISKNPNDVFARVQLARLYESSADWKKAASIYEQALSKDSDSSLVLAALANVYMRGLNEPQRALEYVRRAWNVAPTPTMAGELGPIAYLAGDYKWAGGRLLEAMRAQPTGKVIFYRGLVSYALGAVTQARDDLGRLGPNSDLSNNESVLSQTAKEIIAFQLGKGSIDQFERALQTATGIDTQFIPALIGNGLRAEQKGDFQAARTAYESALQYRSGLLVAQRQLAILLAEKLADDAKAEKLATTLRQELPDDPVLAKVLGKISYRRTNYREAMRLLAFAAPRIPEDSDLNYHLGLAQYRLNDTGAKATLTKALAMEPNAKLATEAKNALAQLK